MRGRVITGGQVEAVAREVGVGEDVISQAREMPMASGIEVVKAAVKAAWKKKAFELHPDRNGGDDEAFKAMKQKVEFVMALKVVERTPMPMPLHVPVLNFINMTFNFNVNGSTQGTQTGGPSGFGYMDDWVRRSDTGHNDR